MYLAIGRRGSMSIWTHCMVRRPFLRKTELTPCTDWSADRRPGDSQLCNKGGALGPSWMWIPSGSDGGRLAHIAVMVGVPRWM
jgi:hypothetical protein